jgi:hypothetical protein
VLIARASALRRPRTVGTRLAQTPPTVRPNISFPNSPKEKTKHINQSAFYLSFFGSDIVNAGSDTEISKILSKISKRARTEAI